MHFFHKAKSLAVPDCLGPGSLWRKLFNSAARHGWVAFPLLFVGYVSSICPWWAIYEFDVDEGFNMAKAVLVANGFRLYAEIWNDQPPLLTCILALREYIAPWNIAQARAIVLLFSCVLLGSLFRIVNRFEGRSVAWIAVLILAGDKIYERVSVSVMIGLPALALAVLALERCVNTRGKAGLALSGVLFGLAVQTKLFVLPLALAFPLVIMVNGLRATTPVLQRLASLVLWAASFCLCMGVTAAAFDLSFEQLVSPHLSASSEAIGRFASAVELFRDLWHWTALLPASLLGVFAIIRRPQASRLIPSLLGMVTFLILANHKPLYYHQVLLVALPLSWLGAIGTAYLIEIVRSDGLTRGAAVGLHVLLLTIAILLVPDSLKMYRMQRYDLEGQNVLRKLNLYNATSDFVYSDHPIDVYYLNMLMPPAIAVPSKKRIKTGHLEPAAFIHDIETWKPSQVMFRRGNLKYPQEIREYLDEKYVRVPDDESLHYIREKPVFDTSRLLDLTLLAAGEYAFMSLRGGYAGFMDPVTGDVFERHRFEAPVLPAGTITIRPPGSTASVGRCVLALADLTGREFCRQAALEAARALACAQSPAGGWPAIWEMSGACDPHLSSAVAEVRNTLDEGIQQQVLDFLLDLRIALSRRGEKIPGWLQESIADGFEFLLNVQKVSGGWPRQIPAANHYSQYSTLNDKVMSSSISILLRGYEVFGDKRFLEAAARGGRFLVRVQGKAPQSGWAQQYNDSLQPVEARNFEPEAFSSRESAYAMVALIELFLKTRDPVFAAPLPAAARWLETSMIRPGVWARFYEIGSNRPLYGDRDKSIHYSLDEISRERRESYDWEKSFPEVLRGFDLVRALEASGYDGLKEAWDEARRRERDTARSVAWKTVAELMHGGPQAFRMEGGLVSARKFIASCTAVIDYIQSVQTGI